MTSGFTLQLGLLVALCALTARPLGHYLVRVYAGEATGMQRLLGPLERAIYRTGRIDPQRDMSWGQYAWAFAVFHLGGIALAWVLLQLQPWLPFNAAHLPAQSWHLALNTAVSFVTNTNWQSYAGELSLSNAEQLVALTPQNFLSPAAGLALAVALARGLGRSEVRGLGNFWADLVRGTLYVMLPLSLVLALVLVSQGVVQTLAPQVTVPLLQATSDGQGHAIASQVVPLGPVASQVAIRQLGTNGGGFFNANSAHPFENPTALSNLLQMWAMVIVSIALCFAYGKWVGQPRQGRVLLAVMVALFALALAGLVAAESTNNPLLAGLGSNSAGFFEGKESRFGPGASALWATITTATSTGAVNAMHDSLSPLGGMVAMTLMQLGEVVFGGVGSGLAGMVVFAVVAVFMAGLMVGRTPEYLAKKIEVRDMQWATLAVVLPSLAVLAGTGVFVMADVGRAGMLEQGPHGLSEVLYAFSSAANNNGSAFAGLTVDNPPLNLALAAAMLVGRLGVGVAVLALAGSLVAKPKVAVTAGTLPTHGPLFAALLLAVVVLVGALTFLPVLALGPLAEQLAPLGGAL